jgi:pilus assembly protein Flp/PilA
MLTNLIRDERGGEAVEYCVIAGLIVVAALAIISGLGLKVVARWTSLRDIM